MICHSSSKSSVNLNRSAVKSHRICTRCRENFRVSGVHHFVGVPSVEHVRHLCHRQKVSPPSLHAQERLDSLPWVGVRMDTGQEGIGKAG